MGISVAPVDEAQVQKVLSLEEGHFHDVKAIDISPSKLTRSLAAFGNADGGELYVGIDEAGPRKVRRWRGFLNPEAANAHLQVFEHLFPLGQDFQYEFLVGESYPGCVLHVTVQKTRDVKSASDGKHYVRGAQTFPWERTLSSNA